MKKRLSKKAEKLKRANIHKMLDLALDINGLQGSMQALTGNHPTAFFKMSGHTAGACVRVFPNGWNKETNFYLESVELQAYFDNGYYGSENTLEKKIEALKEIKKKLEEGQRCRKKNTELLRESAAQNFSI